MNKTIIATSIALAGIAAIATYTWVSYMKDLQERFPEIDKKIIRKAYLTFFLKSANQEYDGIDSLNDAQMDALFLIEVQKLTNK